MAKVKERAISFGAGASAGFVEVCIMHPLDLIKTRLQIQSKTAMSKSDPEYYNGIIDLAVKMYKKEGIPAFWKGIIPPILIDTPRRAVKFFTFDEYKRLFMRGKPTASPLTYSLAGMCAGATEGALVTPFEVVKVTLQANRKKMKEVPSTFSVAKDIYRTHGFGSRGFLKGFTATVMRATVFNLVYFGLYHSVKDTVLIKLNRKATFLEKVAVGFTSGTLASVANIPIDVAKSMIQGPQPEPGKVKYRTLIKTMRMVYNEEGFRALYKGLLPKVLRLGPGGAIMLLVDEYVGKYLSDYFL